MVEASDFFDGHYRLTAEDSSLEALMFVAKPQAIRDAALSVCRAIAEPTRKLACERVVSACRTAEQCLQTKPASEPCADRIDLDPSALDLEVYSTGGAKTLEIDPTADAAKLLDGTKLCGPQGNPSCPDRMPAVVVTEDGRFRCLAPTSQLACGVSIDLTACGIGRLRGTLDEAGTLDGEINTSTCELEALGAGDQTAGGGPGFAITCGSRRLVATYAGSFPGTVRCAIQGPSAFDPSDVTGGLISGVLPVTLLRRGDKVVMIGKGYDTCAIVGCESERHVGCIGDCATCCDTGCTSKKLDRCIPGPLSSCGVTSESRCVETCVAFCANPSLCTEGAAGRSIVIADPTAPFIDDHLNRIDLDIDNRPRLASRAFQGLLNIAADGDPPVIVGADRWKVMVYEEGAGNATLVPIDTQHEPAIDFEISGLLRHPTQPALFYVFGGDNTAAAGEGRVVRARIQLETDNTVTKRSAVVAELPAIDAAAVVGDNLFVIAGARPASTPTGPSKIIRLDVNDLTKIGDPIQIDGIAEHLASLGPSLVVAVSKDEAHTLLVLDPTTGATLETHQVIRGLEINTLLTDGDRLFVGYRKNTGLTSTATGLVGVLQTAGDRRVLHPPFAATVGDGVDILALHGKRLYAVSSFANWITPIDLN